MEKYPILVCFILRFSHKLTEGGNAQDLIWKNEDNEEERNDDEKDDVEHVWRF